MKGKRVEPFDINEDVPITDRRMKRLCPSCRKAYLQWNYNLKIFVCPVCSYTDKIPPVRPRQVA